VQTFVVRVFRSEQDRGGSQRGLCGVVDDIGAGSRTAFSDAAQLLSILARPGAPASAEDASDNGPSAQPTHARPPTARRISCDV
jgi:hypothetical protein